MSLKKAEAQLRTNFFLLVSEISRQEYVIHNGANKNQAMLHSTFYSSFPNYFIAKSIFLSFFILGLRFELILVPILTNRNYYVLSL